MEDLKQLEGKIVYAIYNNQGSRGVIYRETFYNINFLIDGYITLKEINSGEINSVREISDPSDIEKRIAKAVVSNKPEVKLKIPFMFLRNHKQKFRTA